jgi:hypothetical protein
MFAPEAFLCGLEIPKNQMGGAPWPVLLINSRANATLSCLLASPNWPLVDFAYLKRPRSSRSAKAPFELATDNWKLTGAVVDQYDVNKRAAFSISASLTRKNSSRGGA